ncbi:MAG: hypothetical protein AB1435_02905 [Chloroflexota bacterium]
MTPQKYRALIGAADRRAAVGAARWPDGRRLPAGAPAPAGKPRRTAQA